MQVQDLGEISGDIVIFGGPVSNLHATKAMIGVVGDRPAICLGDLAAYCGNPAETVRAIRATGWPVLAGNCEQQLASRAEDCGCGFAEDSQCDRLSGAWYAFADQAIGDDDRRWMGNLPDVLTYMNRGRRYVGLHGGWTSVNRFIWPSDDASVFREELDAIRAALGPIDGVLASHSGIAFERVIDGVSWLNVGAIGLPPHDGRPETRYAVLRDDGAHIERLTYPADAAAKVMEQVGLTQGYQRALTTGIWPSEEVLPLVLRR